MMNSILKSHEFPKLWRKSKVISILKPGKDSALPKSYTVPKKRMKSRSSFIHNIDELIERVHYNKTDGLSPSTRKLTGYNSPKTQSPISLRPTIPINIHTANIIFTNIILMADKHNIPKARCIATACCYPTT